MDPDPTSRRDGYGNLLLRNGVIFRYGDTERHDLLTDYGDVPIPHDAVGNPLELCGQKLGWERGTRLVSFGKNAYRYRSDGLRIEKSENGRRHRYFYDGDRLVAEQIGNAYSGTSSGCCCFFMTGTGRFAASGTARRNTGCSGIRQGMWLPCWMQRGMRLHGMHMIPSGRCFP